MEPAVSAVVLGSYLVSKYALMVAGDPFITGRKQRGVFFSFNVTAEQAAKPASSAPTRHIYLTMYTCIITLPRM